VTTSTGVARGTPDHDSDVTRVTALPYTRAREEKHYRDRRRAADARSPSSAMLRSVIEADVPREREPGAAARARLRAQSPSGGRGQRADVAALVPIALRAADGDARRP